MVHLGLVKGILLKYSSIAALLGNRLGITSILSTDSIRHIMRNFENEKEN